MSLATAQSLTYAQVRDRLEEIDRDLAQRQPEFEENARTYFKAKRDWEAALASAYVKAEGKNQEERRARALLSLMRDPAYKALVIAEADYEATKGVMRTLETRASIGQSLLRVTAQERGA